ncbi:MAG TPA: hypothetical protein VF708_18625 [Pyrinomonadaceae bacterium]|jgi:hypothetical protein
MKSIVCATIFALFLLSFTAPRSATAQSADGSLKFAVEDDLTKSIEFNATTDGVGSMSGEMTFSGPAEIPDQDVDGTGDRSFSGRLENLQIEARFDGMLVERNRAVMSGTVTGSNLEDYIGQRVLLVVEDVDGDGEKTQDTLTWGLYKPVEQRWTPTDAELENDEGARLTWWATDAEREDDRGITSHPSNEITAQSFPLSSYSFDLMYAEGEIQVRP